MHIREFPLSQEQLRTLLNYAPATGVFTWRVNRSRLAKAGDVAGYLATTGYWAIGLCGQGWPAHRLAWLYVHGVWPPELVDHVSRDQTDNRITNLRLASVSENRQNMTKYRNNKSGFKGVHWFKGTGKWQAQIKHHGKRYHLGFFTDVGDAAMAYAKAASNLHTFNPDAARSA